MRIIILGPTGTGKSTQAEFISKMLKLKHIEAGALLRKLAKKNKLVRNFIDKGRLVPNKIVSKLVKKEIKNSKNFVLDGFPRTLSQLKSINIKPDLVLFLKVDKYNLIRRLFLRKREDDSKNNIEKRYRIYLKQTLPVLNHYKKMGILMTIDGNPSIKEVSKNIKKKLIRYPQQ